MSTISKIGFNSNLNQKSNITPSKHSAKLHSQPMSDTVNFGRGLPIEGVTVAVEKVAQMVEPTEKDLHTFFGKSYIQMQDLPYIFVSQDFYKPSEVGKAMKGVKDLAEQNLTKYKPAQFGTYINRFLERSKARTVSVDSEDVRYLLASKLSEDLNVKRYGKLVPYLREKVKKVSPDKNMTFVKLKVGRQPKNKIAIDEEGVMGAEMKAHIIERFKKPGTKESFVAEDGTKHTIKSYFNEDGFFQGIKVLSDKK